MKTNHFNWSKSEFKTYLLPYCANADISQSTEELHFIKDRISKSTFKAKQKVFNEYLDYQSITLIQQYVKEHNYTHEDLKPNFKEVKNIFRIDGNYDHMDKYLFNMLKSILDS